MEEKLKAVSYPKGTVLYHEGDPNNGKMYVVNEEDRRASVKIHGRDRGQLYGAVRATSSARSAAPTCRRGHHGDLRGDLARSALCSS
ncbi:MAG: hypothetical protein U0166_28490 [Acidobacteriota bacterium]